MHSFLEFDNDNGFYYWEDEIGCYFIMEVSRGIKFYIVPTRCNYVGPIIRINYKVLIKMRYTIPCSQNKLDDPNIKKSILGYETNCHHLRGEFRQ